MRYVLKFLTLSLIFPVALFAHDNQAPVQSVSVTRASSVRQEPIFKPSEPFFVPAIDFARYYEFLSENNEYVPGNQYFSPSSLQELALLKKQSRQECFALHSVLTAYVTGKLEGEYDINMVIKHTLKLGLGIRYTPGNPLMIFSNFSGYTGKKDILFLPFHPENTVAEEDKPPITEALNEIEEMQEMFQHDDDGDDWLFRMAQLHILNQHGVFFLD